MDSEPCPHSTISLCREAVEGADVKSYGKSLSWVDGYWKCVAKGLLVGHMYPGDSNSTVITPKGFGGAIVLIFGSDDDCRALWHPTSCRWKWKALAIPCHVAAVAVGNSPAKNLTLGTRLLFWHSKFILHWSKVSYKPIIFYVCLSWMCKLLKSRIASLGF